MKSHRYLAATAVDRLNPAAFTDQFEFDEADIWTTNDTIHLPKQVSTHRTIRKPVRKVPTMDQVPVGAKSLPVNVPDWSKILRGEYTTRATRECEDNDVDEEEDDNGNYRLPPHEYLARTRVASFSVHEGIGRTLKGRDLSRVRNAIWKQTGFED